MDRSTRIFAPKGNLGTYSASLSFGNDDNSETVASHNFEVQEYTPNAFEITSADRNRSSVRRLSRFHHGQILHGKSLSKAQLSWSIEAEDMTFTAAASTSSAFCDAIDDYR